MADCRPQFNEFHDAIKLKEENKVLKDKREIIIKRIKEKLPEQTDYCFEIFNQGSYAMRTGIKPLDSDYDIDVGLYFDMSKDDVDPIEAKKWIYNALLGHTSDVKIKNPCITVTYAAGYHVDLTVYAAANSDNKVYLAKGKPTSKAEDKFWEESNPKDLIKVIKEHLSDADDRKQFRRIVRYLKRWKDVNFTSVNGKPSGIALTSCAYHWLNIQKEIDAFTGIPKYKDLDALIHIVSTMISNFYDEYVEIDGEYKFMPRLKVELPVEPRPELFEKMTYKQMVVFKEKLENFLTALNDSKDETDPTDAAKILRKQLGDDFPVPEKSATGKMSVAAAVIPSSESASEETKWK
ncbi:nucleotidyltransferase domain-containing protein [Cytobacillus oceanisediminis]|uniref:nucleotidyltransferase domain-containing protein n=1 Tax=Cytobacillus oceanisediminis TaxID=665099 RepID=UPI00203F28D6|nr:nucleotidyltransferase [Cytobacillus oceanisediminis]MCM3393719.1 nucleotidyltransferase [Cytobacillus oceanisediminis]